MSIASVASIAPLEPRARIYEVASHTFVNGAWRGLQCLTLARTHGERAILDALETERRRAENAGIWGNWTRLLATLRDGEAPGRPIPRRDVRIAPGASQGR